MDSPAGKLRLPERDGQGMHLFRNEEVKRFTLFYMLAGAGFCAAGGIWISGKAALLLSAACLLFYVVYLCSARKRYGKMSGLAAGIDQMLHSGKMLDLSAFREGELSLLDASTLPRP